jgi:hypothetical protein
MKKIILPALLLIAFAVGTGSQLFGQRADEIISLRVGYGSPNIYFKEALEFERPLKFFQDVLNTGKIFTGNAAEFGISKNISKSMFAEVSFSTLSGRDKAKVDNKENYYTLKGFQLPVTLNYLTGDSTKRLRINLGGGVQFLKAHLQQYETVSINGGQATHQLTDINISEFQLALRPGVQFRIIPDLFASFLVNFGISTNGRFSDNPCLSLKYTFR